MNKEILEKWGCIITEAAYDASDHKKPEITPGEPRLPKLGETLTFRRPESSPAYLYVTEVYRPVSRAVMFAREGQTHCYDCGSPLEIDGIPTSLGISSTSCPQGCNRGRRLSGPGLG